MRIIFSDHAVIKISQRKIVRANVIKTVSSPDLIHYSSNGRDKYYKKFTKLHLRVVAKTLKPKTIVIITVHWVAKMPNKG